MADPGSLRSIRTIHSIQFIELNEPCRGDVKHGILWKFALFPTFVDLNGFDKFFPFVELNGFDKFFTFVEFMGLTISLHLLN